MKPSNRIFLPPSRWRFRGKKPFSGVADIRGLLPIRHPWTESVRGNHADWQTCAQIPANWFGKKAFISFYQSDTYCGLNRIANNFFGVQAFVGHRFKQLLINDQLVWEQDVADDELAGPVENYYYLSSKGKAFQDPYRVLNISTHLQRHLRVVFRVADKVGSGTILKGDRYRRYAWGKFDPALVAKRFQTDVYFGDIFLTLENKPVRPGSRPTSSEMARPLVSKTKSFHAESVAIPSEGVKLELQCAAALPSIGFPVRCGIPLPRGAVPQGEPLQLRNDRGQPLIAAFEPISWWPDHSIRWALGSFVPRHTGSYLLAKGKSAAPLPSLKKRRPNAFSNGCLEIQAGHSKSKGVFDKLTLDGKQRLGLCSLSLKLNCIGRLECFTAERTACKVEQDNGLCQVLRLNGNLISASRKRFGPWQARVYLWRDLPCLIMDWQTVNESDQFMAMLLDWSLRFRLPGLDGATADFGRFRPPRHQNDLHIKAVGHLGHVADLRNAPIYDNSSVMCCQETANDARLYEGSAWVGSTDRAAGYVHVRHPQQGMVAAVKWFYEEFPKGIRISPHELTLSMGPEYPGSLGWRHDIPFARIGRGEAKRQTIAIWFLRKAVTQQDAENFNACVQDMPRLFNRRWFLQGRVIETGAATPSVVMRRWEKTAGPVIAETGIHFPRLGHREYWDTAWMNNYRSRARMGLFRYFETGDLRWRRYFDAACCHYRDVDIIHFCPEHPDWVHNGHAEGPDHTSRDPASSKSAGADDLLDHYLMNGDLDSLAAARALAEKFLQFPVYARSAREIGWPLAQLARWHDQFKDRRFLRRARQYFEAARLFTEPRRGVFVQLHGSLNYRGAVTFMAGFLAHGVIRYHEATGDPAALELLQSLADGLAAEGMVAPGVFRYSPNPENNVVITATGVKPQWGSGATPLMGGLMGYLYLVTGNVRFQKLARQCFQHLMRNPDQIKMDRLQIAGWMLRALGPSRQSRPAWFSSFPRCI